MERNRPTVGLSLIRVHHESAGHVVVGAADVPAGQGRLVPAHDGDVAVEVTRRESGGGVISRDVVIENRALGGVADIYRQRRALQIGHRDAEGFAQNRVISVIGQDDRKLLGLQIISKEGQGRRVGQGRVINTHRGGHIRRGDIHREASGNRTAKRGREGHHSSSVILDNLHVVDGDTGIRKAVVVRDGALRRVADVHGVGPGEPLNIRQGDGEFLIDFRHRRTRIIDDVHRKGLRFPGKPGKRESLRRKGIVRSTTRSGVTSCANRGIDGEPAVDTRVQGRGEGRGSGRFVDYDVRDGHHADIDRVAVSTTHGVLQPGTA